MTYAKIVLLLLLAVLFSNLLSLNGARIGYLIAEFIYFGIAIIVIKLITVKECAVFMKNKFSKKRSNVL